MNVPRRIFCLFVLVASFALAGCGGGSPTSPSGGAKDQADKKAKTKGLEMPPKLD